MIITIDGPAGSGKSTAARKLAARLGIAFLDTGAMYHSSRLRMLGKRRLGTRGSEISGTVVSRPALREKLSRARRVANSLRMV